MFIQDLFKKPGRQLILVRSTAAVEDAVRLLIAHEIGAVLVTDEHGELAGIFSERDLARCIHRDGRDGPVKGVSAYMTHNPVCCDIGDTLESVMSLMNARHIRHLPVVDRGRLVGMVSIRDVIAHLLEATAGERDTLRDYVATGTC